MNSIIQDNQRRLFRTFQKGKHGSKTGSIVWKIAAVLFWLLIWYAAARLVDQEVLIPRPLAVWKSFAGLAATAEFWKTIAMSIARILAGFACAFLLGILFAACTYKSAIFRDILEPLLSAVKATPVASFIILALMWFTTGKVPIFICFLMVLPTVWANIGEGLQNTDQKLVEMAVLYGMNRRKILRHIYVPSLLPYVRASFKAGFGMAWKAGVAAEVIGRPAFSIGKNLYLSKIYIDMPAVFAWTLTVIAISILLEKLLSLAVQEK